MTFLYHPTGQITFNNNMPTNDTRWQRIKWEEEQKRRTQKEIDEEREELRGIYKVINCLYPITLHQK